jgi:predicted Zn-dependent protease with MMP-like domain
MTKGERDRFDAIFDRVLRELPQRIRDLFDESPLILEDRPTKEIMEEFDLDENADALCGLYTGTPLTERSVSHVEFPPDQIHIFREGIVSQAGGWRETTDADGNPTGGEDAIAREIRITILHELGHHFGLDEEDLVELGYE